VVRTTWLPTLLFTIAVWLASMVLQAGVRLTIACAVGSLLFTPLIWWWCVGRLAQPTAVRGAIAGWLIVPTVLVLQFLISGAASRLKRPPDWHPSPGWAGLDIFLYFWMFVVVGIPGAAVGAAMGALIAWLQRVLASESSAWRD